MVGKVVNKLFKRKDTPPDVISSSKALVDKWKELVKNAEKGDKSPRLEMSNIEMGDSEVDSNASTCSTPAPSMYRKSFSKLFFIRSI